MSNSGDIVIGTEARARRVQKKRSDTPEDTDSTVATTVDGLFQPILTGLRKLPGLSKHLPPITIPTAPLSSSASGGVTTPPTPPTPTAASTAGDPPLPLDDVVRRWFKEMDHTAAQQVKSATSNPTGNLRLSQEEAAINHKVYFRDDFFGGLPWTPSDGKVSEQEVVVRFHTWVDGQDLGEHDLRLSHDPRRIAGQGNVPTVLHWGPLGPILRRTNYIGFNVTLERVLGGRFNLVISEAPRGEYIV